MIRNKNIFVIVGLISGLILAGVFFIAQVERRVKITTSSGEVLGEAIRVKPRVKIDVAESSLTKPRLFQYDPPLKIKAIYKSMDEAKNKTPEELMISIKSASNQEWLNYNTKGGKAGTADPVKLARRLAYDPDLYYFELIHKLEFERKGIPVAIMKYWLVKEGKRTYRIAAWLEKNNDRWVRGPTTKETQYLEAIIRFVKTKYLQDIITGRRSDNDLVNELARKSRKNGAFDTDLFAEQVKILRSTEEGTARLMTIFDRPEK